MSIYRITLNELRKLIKEQKIEGYGSSSDMRKQQIVLAKIQKLQGLIEKKSLGDQWLTFIEQQINTALEYALGRKLSKKD